MRRLTLRPQLLFGVALAAMTAACGISPVATPAPTPTIVPALPPLVPTATPVPAAAPANTPVATLTPLAQPSPTAPSVAVVAKPTAEPRLPGPASETATLASRFEAAINAGDVEGVLALFEPTAEVKVPPDRYVGPTQIRNWITYLATNHFAIEPGFRNVVGERAAWPAEVRSDYLDRIGLPSLHGNRQPYLAQRLDPELYVRPDRRLSPSSPRRTTRCIRRTPGSSHCRPGRSQRIRLQRRIPR
jgi:hypothetical protein